MKIKFEGGVNKSVKQNTLVNVWLEKSLVHIGGLI